MPFITEYTNRELELWNLIECGAPLWLPNPENTPQMMGYLSTAEVLGFGGAAGGGKTELIIGKAVNQHQKTMIVREEGTQMTAIVDRLREIFKGNDGYNGQEKIWRLPKRGQQIEFGSIPNPGDETKYQGRPHEFLAFDEATNVRAAQVRFLFAWLRNANWPVSEALLTFNPPVNAEGRWVLEFFEPWLKGGVKPGEIRYFLTTAQKDIMVPDNRPRVLINDVPEVNFNPADYSLEDIIEPMSRTFIPSRLTDNTYLGREYMRQLQALPEPLRSMMLKGDFMAGVQDSVWQIIPTAWVELAVQRWAKPVKVPPMDSMGVDVARGGTDNTILITRHDMWFNEVVKIPGRDTPDGPEIMGHVIRHLRNDAVVHIDAVGVGSSPFDFLRNAHFQTVGVNGGEGTNETDKAGVMGFANVKSLLWWRAREAFDPANNTGIAIPNDPQLKKDLTSLVWSPEGKLVRAESRKEIIKRIGRSPDWGSAFVLALMKTPKRAHLARMRGENKGGHDPLAILDN